MKKICFHIQKGGVGKTSISCSVAHCFARKKIPTILVDCDPQGNATSWLFPHDIPFDITDVLFRGMPLAKALIPLNENLTLLPVIAIGGQLKELSETKLAQNPRAFEFLLADLKAMGFQYAILDCSPSFSLLERAVIGAVDEVINPLSPEFFSIDGIELFTSILEDVQRANRRKIRNDKIVINMLNKSFARHKAFAETLQKWNYRVFTIPQDSKIAESQIARQSIFDYEPKAKSIIAFETLSNAILEDR
ncbi:hypothetical protein FACS1894172_08320 [Spirochaetia bacterium]|nr:hypothetical protein FACS1894164_07920 [Spirochaetia bacterium]GHU32168.1 hypothetical protein FACS1894172_08320 [Spirochaetia bacterium]